MKKAILLILSCMLCLFLPAQNSKNGQRKPATTQQRKTTTTTQKKKPATQQKKASTTSKTTTTKKASTTSKTTTSKRQQKKKSTTKSTGKDATIVTSPSAERLQAEKERRRIEEERHKTEVRRDEIKVNVKKGLEQLMVIDNEIEHQRMIIDTIRNDISSLNTHINLLDSQLVILQQELDDRKGRYMKSMRYQHRNRSVQSQLAFVFSADNFNQMYRRLRFNREYAAFQKAQGEAVMAKQEQVNQKKEEIAEARKHKGHLLARGEQVEKNLKGKQNEQKVQVDKLKKEQKTVQNLIEQQQKQEAELNARIDKLIEEEIAREKARIEAEERKRAAEEAERKRQAEIARQKAEAARRENERRIAEAKAREEAARRKAQAAAQKSAEERAEAERQMREAKQELERAQEKDRSDQQLMAERERVERARAQATYHQPSTNVKLSDNFVANQGRLPMPITGAYQLVRAFGPYSPAGLSRVHLQSNGWTLKGMPGAKAQSIFNGVVSGVFVKDGNHIVTVRHGKYISVYINLSSVSVKPNQHVTAQQAIGTVSPDNTMSFQLRNWNTPLNPAAWIRR